MPLALRELQEAFAAHLAGQEQPALAAEIGPAAARLRIHRHHVLDSLASALAATFPTVQAVVGTDFFTGLARAFIVQSLPNQPVLAEYGAGFPGFIAGHAVVRDLPYLADVALLDWMLNLAFHAPAGARLAASDLAAVPADCTLVAIHDAARPLVTLDAIHSCLADAAEHGAAVLGVPMKATVKESEDGAFVAECDALYVTRVQRERFESQALYERTKGSYVVDAALLRTAEANCAVLHPLPRVDEIATDVDALPNAAYFRQMEHGLYARMALLDLVLGRPSMLDGLRAALGL